MGKAQTDRHPAHTHRSVAPAAEAKAAKSGSDWWVRMEQVEDPLDSCCSWEEGTGPKADGEKPEGLPVDKSTQRWVTGYGCRMSGDRTVRKLKEC